MPDARLQRTREGNEGYVYEPHRHRFGRSFDPSRRMFHLECADCGQQRDYENPIYSWPMKRDVAHFGDALPMTME